MLKAYQRLTLRLVERVNRHRRLPVRTREALAPPKVSAALLDSFRQASERGFTAGPLGEASVRLQGGKLLITPKHAWPASLSAGELQIASIKGEWASDNDLLPAHLAWHRAIYRASNAQAVLLSQPASALVLAQRGEHLDPIVFPEAEGACGGIAYLDDETEAIAEASARSGVIMLGSLGILAFGARPAEALARTAIITRWSEIQLG